MSNHTVHIQYCVPCGHLPRALDVQKSILERFGQKLGGVTLKPGDHGIFTIDVNGERVYTKPEEFELDALLEAIDQRVTGATAQ
ncbi:MAG: Rdx family protein [Trueperaceae bacterium]|jgi:selenoprotein W-related protein|nr:Rdx family protein [Truepera sp.]HRN19475.1 Rdx family protein [Trueperaceae bacterium]HRQ11536.1 Rdx family protein [Trueperaceae bacterium]